HRHVSRYAPLDVPCRRTIIRRNLVELFLTVTLTTWTSEYNKEYLLNSLAVSGLPNFGYVI
ncbi:MAG: hypothetical protein AB1Z28_10380, partial [Desulfobacterales bacterium]